MTKQMKPKAKSESLAKRNIKKVANQKARFLSVLEKVGVIKLACHAADAGRSTVYDWRLKDPAFAEAWDVALEDGVDMLEAEAIRRASRSSDSLLIFLLKAKRPELYREHYEHHHMSDAPIQVQEIIVRNRVEAKDLLDMFEKQNADRI